MGLDPWARHLSRAGSGQGVGESTRAPVGSGAGAEIPGWGHWLSPTALSPGPRGAPEPGQSRVGQFRVQRLAQNLPRPFPTSAEARTCFGDLRASLQ